MTGPGRAGRPSRPAQPACAQLSGGLLAGYASGALDEATAWSVEAHVPGCAPCRTALAARLDGSRLERNKSVLLTRLALPRPGPVGRALRWCRVPDHVVTLLSATPALRRSWLAGVALVLAAAIGAAYLVAPDGLAGGPALAGPAVGGPATSGATLAAAAAVRAWVALMPYLAIAPLVPLIAVAAAFSARLDPAYELALAAPVSALWLLLVRATAVVAVTLVPTAVAALALPGPWWLASVLLLPALAVCAAALAAGTAVGPVTGAVGAGAAWLAVVTAATVAQRPAVAFGPAGQAAAAAVLLAAAAVLAVRRDRFESVRTRRAGP
ncbi:MAG TPA: zf-HC2 domain-containing protein [Streptosporangiaceae bacterium]|nr:zf-HC2 domain-containing protein [Streptosporangiaceae bacterium]